jgi:hypothetical protein
MIKSAPMRTYPEMIPSLMIKHFSLKVLQNVKSLKIVTPSSGDNIFSAIILIDDKKNRSDDDS